MPTRVLMSAPRFAPRLESERSWLPEQPPLDRELAGRQWERLRLLVHDLIGSVELLPAAPWAPAMTFTRDVGLMTGDRFVALRPASTRGAFEVPLVRRHIESLGIELAWDEAVQIDGGNVLADSHSRLLIGLTASADQDTLVQSARQLETATGRFAHRVPLAGGRWPHVDMAICDLNGRGWLVYPDALAGFDAKDPAWQALFLGLPLVIADPTDGERLACNLIVNDDLAIGPEISDTLRRQIEQVGIKYVATPLTELLKAGGGAHCLTLELPPAPALSARRR